MWLEVCECGWTLRGWGVCLGMVICQLYGWYNRGVCHCLHLTGRVCGCVCQVQYILWQYLNI